MSTRNEPHRALAHRCPFCQADPGQPCRKHRGRSDIETRPHSRRIALTRSVEERQLAKRVSALCCVCGNRRTVSDDYSRYQDPNHAGSARGKAEGWLKTQTLKCEACGDRTRHALLNPSDARWRDWDEDRQRIALGDDDTSKYPMGEENIERLRREYRELFPRNPYLRHRRFTEDAKKAWAEGHKQVTALCGEQITIHVDPNLPSTKKAEDPGRIVADQLSDTEYEDPETGLWWLDMACVDCCRVSNNLHWAARRERMIDWIRFLYARPERVPDSDIDSLIAAFEAAAEKTASSDRKDADR